MTVIVPAVPFRVVWSKASFWGSAATTTSEDSSPPVRGVAFGVVLDPEVVDSDVESEVVVGCAVVPGAALVEDPPVSPGSPGLVPHARVGDVAAADRVALLVPAPDAAVAPAPAITIGAAMRDRLIRHRARGPRGGGAPPRDADG